MISFTKKKLTESKAISSKVHKIYKILENFIKFSINFVMDLSFTAGVSANIYHERFHKCLIFIFISFTKLSRENVFKSATTLFPSTVHLRSKNYENSFNKTAFHSSPETSPFYDVHRKRTTHAGSYI